MIIDQGNTFLCASYCFAYALHDHFNIALDVNWLPAMRRSHNATLDGHLHVLQEFGALPIGDYSVDPQPTRDMAQKWLTLQRKKLLKLAAPYKVKEWKQALTVEGIYESLENGWYGVFIASQYRREKITRGYYYPYDGDEHAGTHAMSLWVKDGKLWVKNTRGEEWGIGGGAYVRDSDVLKGGQCYLFRF